MEKVIIGNPYFLQFNLLTACINDCEYCYLRGYKSGNLSYKRVSLLLNKFQKYFDDYGLTISVSLTGGDLFMYPSLGILLKYLKKAEYVSSVYLLLNSLWYKNSKDRILLIKDKIGGIQLNIDNIHDRLEDLAWLYEENIPVNVKVLLSNDNIYYTKQLEILRKIIKLYPRTYVSVDRFVPVKKEQIKMVCSYEELKEKVRVLKIISKGNFITDDPIVGNLLEVDNKEGDSLMGCSIGRGSITIYPDGSIKLCSRIPSYDTGFTVENFDLEKYVSFTTRLLENTYKECRKCSSYESCFGGCPATSFVLDNKLSKDIHCVWKTKK